MVKQNDTPDRWAAESYSISKDFAYSGITEDEELPEWYVSKGKEIVMERMALGGRRLADTLKSIYKKYLENQEKEKTKVE